MTEKQITELRAIVALQAQIKELEREVSRRLQPFKDYHHHFVIENEIWELSRWGELYEPIRNRQHCLTPKQKRLNPRPEEA